ncbi:TolC family protein [Pedobacter sp. BS3]|uniref:TolC family protein n=1 Tax=Pedobacter sp. BS3 TaxID=2567937 RepID=UPI0011EE1C6C|nr:TolC family protein [Pedobacter sp. BS3]TZF84047.1 TolC family protein [Pedobacter sp. BS3]
MRYILALVYAFIAPLFINQQLAAQEKLTVEQAVQIALQNNYDIKLVSNSLDISKNNVSLANAGILPMVSGDFNSNATIQNTDQTQSTGQVVHREGAKNSSMTYGVNLNWKIFDGFEMFANYDRLKELQKLGEVNLRSTILGTVTNVINAYYSLVSQQQALNSAETTLEISQLRLRNATNRYSIGKAAKLEVLNAKVDLNTDTTNLLRMQDAFKTSKIQLNELLARDINTDFTITDTIIIDNQLALNTLQNQMASLNPDLQAAIVNQRIAELNLKQVKASRYPDISFNTGYNFSKTTSELGFARQSQGKGFNYGLTASINIFNGFLQKKNEKNAAIEIENARLEYDKLHQNIQSQLLSAYQTYQTNLKLVTLEQKNQAVAKQNLDITLEKFKLGTVAPIDFREAQLNYVEASVRYTNAQYAAKISEIALKQLSGTLELQ